MTVARGLNRDDVPIGLCLLRVRVSIVGKH